MHFRKLKNLAKHRFYEYILSKEEWQLWTSILCRAPEQ